MKIKLTDETKTSAKSILSGLSLTGNAISEAGSHTIGDGLLGVYLGYDTVVQVSFPTKLLFVGVYDLSDYIESPVYTITNESEKFALKVEVVGFIKNDGDFNAAAEEDISAPAEEGDVTPSSDSEADIQANTDVPLYITGVSGTGFADAETGKLLGPLSETNTQELGTLGKKSSSNTDTDTYSNTEPSNSGSFTITGKIPSGLKVGSMKRGHFTTKFKLTPLFNAESGAENGNVVEGSRLPDVDESTTDVDEDTE